MKIFYSYVALQKTGGLTFGNGQATLPRSFVTFEDIQWIEADIVAKPPSPFVWVSIQNWIPLEAVQR